MLSPDCHWRSRARRCAARLWGCTQRLREEIGSAMSAPERARHERLLADVRSALHDDAAFDARVERGALVDPGRCR